MVELQKDTENKILKAAEEEFIQKGMTGTRMQEIANRAGINKALLHYYYRSKEKLFMSVFKIAINKFVPKIVGLLETDISLFDLIREFVKNYGEIILKNQFLPLFVLSEIRRNPDMLANTLLEGGIQPKLFYNKVNDAKKQGLIIDIDPRNIIINLLSMVIFPVAGKPMLQIVFFENDQKAYQKFLEERLKLIPDLIINSIKKQ